MIIAITQPRSRGDLTFCADMFDYYARPPEQRPGAII